MFMADSKLVAAAAPIEANIVDAVPMTMKTAMLTALLHVHVEALAGTHTDTASRVEQRLQP